MCGWAIKMKDGLVGGGMTTQSPWHVTAELIKCECWKGGEREDQGQPDHLQGMEGGPERGGDYFKVAQPTGDKAMPSIQNP